MADFLNLKTLASLGLSLPEQLAEMLAKAGIFPGANIDPGLTGPIAGSEQIQPEPVEQDLNRGPTATGPEQGLGNILGQVGKAVKILQPPAPTTPKLPSAALRAGGSLDSESTMAILNALIQGTSAGSVAPAPTLGALLGR
tara:strand:+ start:7052 stop:7474 length:423 start_codon:yes stop_codon:yes gene_type:complete